MIKEFTVGEQRYIAEIIPDWAINWKIGKTPSHQIALYFDNYDYSEHVTLPDGKYEILGLVKDLMNLWMSPKWPYGLIHVRENGLTNNHLILKILP